MSFHKSFDFENGGVLAYVTPSRCKCHVGSDIVYIVKTHEAGINERVIAFENEEYSEEFIKKNEITDQESLDRYTVSSMKRALDSVTEEKALEQFKEAKESMEKYRQSVINKAEIKGKFVEFLENLQVTVLTDLKED